MKNVKNFKVLLSICLSFSQFQSGVAYKSVAYKKSVYAHLNKLKGPPFDHFNSFDHGTTIRAIQYNTVRIIVP